MVSSTDVLYKAVFLLLLVHPVMSPIVFSQVLVMYFFVTFLLSLAVSGAGNDNNHAHPDTSMKLGRKVH